MASATGCDPQSAIPERTANRSPLPVGTNRLQPPTKPQPTEPFLFPKLRNYFADFPCLPSVTKSETFYLGILMRLSVRPRAMMTRSTNFSRAIKRTPDSTKGVLLFKRAHPFLAATAFDGRHRRTGRTGAPGNSFSKKR